MRDFVSSNKLNTKIDIVHNSSVSIKADTSIKQVFVDSNL